MPTSLRLRSPSRIRAPRRAVTAALGTVGLLALAGLCAAPAAIAETGPASPAPAVVDLLVSADGETFTTDLDTDLFDETDQLIPNDEVSATLWVQNPTDQDADLRVSIRTLTLPPGSFADNVTMSVRTSGSDEVRSSTLRTLTPTDIVAPERVVGPGATVALAITWRLADVAGNVNQGEGAGLDVLVSMVESTPGSQPNPPQSDGGTVVTVTGGSEKPAGEVARLADSGVRGVAWLWPVGGAMLGLGAFLVAARRRKRKP